jgi:hypothetical protein
VEVIGCVKLYAEERGRNECSCKVVEVVEHSHRSYINGCKKFKWNLECGEEISGGKREECKWKLEGVLTYVEERRRKEDRSLVK